MALLHKHSQRPFSQVDCVNKLCQYDVCSKATGKNFGCLHHKGMIIEDIDGYS